MDGRCRGKSEDLSGSKSHREVTSSMIEAFADCSGDRNPVHLDEEFASKTKFGRRIAHGILTASFISALIAETYPGSVYVEQNIRFLRPVFPGDTVETRILPTGEVSESRMLRLITSCFVGDAQVIEGEATIKLAVPA